MKEILKNEPQFWCNKQNGHVVLGKKCKHCGWYPPSEIQEEHEKLCAGKCNNCLRPILKDDFQHMKGCIFPKMNNPLICPHGQQWRQSKQMNQHLASSTGCLGWLNWTYFNKIPTHYLRQGRKDLIKQANQNLQQSESESESSEHN